MKLHDPVYLEFGGESVAGRVPAVLHVYGPELTPEQYGQVRNTYRAFRDALRVSITPQLVQNRSLPDGSSVRMVSNSDVDHIYVNTAPSGIPVRLASLFFCAPGALGGFLTYTPPVTKWKFRGKIDVPETMPASRELTDTPDLSQHPGNLTWFSDTIKVLQQPITLSWYGRANRYGRMDYHGRHMQLCSSSVIFGRMYSPADDFSFSTHRINWQDAFKPAVWTNGIKHRVHTGAGEEAVDVPVMSAALKKTDDGLFLYVVTHDTTLAVYRGRIHPMDSKDVQVEHVFDINFTIDPTAYSVGQPFWETLLQPIYFNASCTAAASLVAVQGASAVNASAAAATPAIAGQFAVVLMQLDLEAMTTSFTTSHVGVVADVDETYTGVPTFEYGEDDTGPYGESLDEDRLTIYTTTRTMYGAVDYSADQMLLALVEYVNQETRHEYGAISVEPGLATLEKTGEISSTTSYRAYFEHDDTTLAEKTTADIATGTIYMEATDGGSGSGYRIEDISAEIFWFASIEGGDLRRSSVVMAEFLEAGTSYFEDTLSPGSADGWSPRNRSGGGPGWSTMSRSTVTDSRGRQPRARFSVWLAGVQLQAGTIEDAGGTVNRSMFGWLNDLLGQPPQAGLGSDVSQWLGWATPYSSSTLAGYDLLPSFTAWNSVTPLSLASHAVSVGNPYVNVSSFSSDGAYGFYDIGPIRHVSGSYFTMPDRYAAFLIDGDVLPSDLTAYVPAGDFPVLNTPVFIDNVPERIEP